jgi:hypothetical protein
VRDVSRQSVASREQHSPQHCKTQRASSSPCLFQPLARLLCLARALQMHRHPVHRCRAAALARPSQQTHRKHAVASLVKQQSAQRNLSSNLFCGLLPINNTTDEKQNSSLFTFPEAAAVTHHDSAATASFSRDPLPSSKYTPCMYCPELCPCSAARLNQLNKKNIQQSVM